MKCNHRVYLSDRERETVGTILSIFAPSLGPVKVFGSRATGDARPGSDLDLVIFPPAPARALSDLRLAFDESDLPITVDVVAWDEIDRQTMRKEVERTAVSFFLESGTGQAG